MSSDRDRTWPEPVSLTDLSGLAPVAPLPIEALPEIMRPWVCDVAARLGCPPDYVAVTALVSAGSVAARGFVIQPKRHDHGWIVRPNVWGAVVGDPGSMKTPALRAGMSPLEVLLQNVEPENAHRNQALERWSALERARAKALERDARDVVDSKSGACGFVGLRTQDGAERPPPPIRFVSNDSSIEALEQVLVGNGCVLVYRDELVAWVRSLEKSGQESARAAFLELWSGKRGFSVDRIGRGHLVVSGCVTVFGGIQPEPLKLLLRRARDRRRPVGRHETPAGLLDPPALHGHGRRHAPEAETA